MKNLTKFLSGVVIVLLTSANSLAQQEPRKTDLPGSEDYSLISRYQGAVIQNYEVIDYGQYVLALGKPVEKEFREHGLYLSKFEDLEGKIIRIQYLIPPEEGIFKVYKNYTLALENANYNILFTSSDREESNWTFWGDDFYGGSLPINKLGEDFYNANGQEGFYFCTAKGIMNENDVYISIFINKGEEYGEQFILVTQEIIEINPLVTRLVTAQKITDNIDRLGHIAIYGVYFETGKYDIKPESEKALTEIAAFLKANPDNKYFIVGHTDNTGDFNANMTLSENRAKAVMDYLVNKSGVDAAQLKAHGVGPMCPVTANSTDSGKARNRRVEIVRQ